MLNMNASMMMAMVPLMYSAIQNLVWLHDAWLYRKTVVYIRANMTGVEVATTAP
jgi:hypothetical protein